MIELSTADIALLQALLPAASLRALRELEPSADLVTESCARLERELALLAPFVPSPVIDIQMTRPGPYHIEGLYLIGTLVFADLSGFTALSSQLATLGREGNEETSAIINRLFAALLEEIYARGGGLIKFGGDALTAFFDDTRLGSNHSALACAAALGMQQRMAEFSAVSTSKGVFQLRLRIAVHSGRVFLAEVGDQSHTELVVTGQAINHVVNVQKAAMPGEIIISDETLQSLEAPLAEMRLPGLYQLNGLPAEPPRPPARPPIWRPGQTDADTLRSLLDQVHAVRPYVPYGLPARFVQAQTSGGEFRPVTVLFVNFYAFSKLLGLLELPALVEGDPTVVGRVLNICYTRTQSVIHRYGGSVNKVDMATFGDRLLALFGAPTAHEDDPPRAVRAALAIRAALADINREIATVLREWTATHLEQRAMRQLVKIVLHQRIGIASGTMFAGIVGTPRRHEYAVMGANVHLAARLLATAEDGDVLLASATRRAVRRLVDTQPIAPVTIEGFAQPVPVFRAVRWREAVELAADDQRHATPLIGRQAELEQVLEFARAAFEPGAKVERVLRLVGDPGIGKSRLVDEALGALREAGPEHSVVHEACQSYRQSVPYALVARLLRQLLRLPSVEDRTVQMVDVQQQLETLVPDWSRFAPLLGPLLNLPLAETDLIKALTPQQRHDRLHDLIVAICFALARRQPLVLVVDHLQWADGSSQALLAHLAAALVDQPLLLLLIYRPVPELAEPWRTFAHGPLIALGELQRADSEALLAALLEGAPPEELRPLIERAHGTPFFLEEIVRNLIESSVLQRDQAGAWICARSIDSDAMPIQIEQLIVARLDRLDDETRALIQVAAVIGQRFSERLLAAVSPQYSALGRRLDALVDAALLLPDARAPGTAYQFKHALIRDVVYGNMLFAHRKELHVHVAAAIELLFAAELDDQQAVLAQHYLLADLPDRAFPYLMQAAQHAQSRYANSEALTLYRQALAIAPWRDREDDLFDREAAVMLYESLGDVLSLMGDYASARKHYEQLLDLIKRSEDQLRVVRQAALLRKIGGSCEHQGDLAQALSWFDRAAAAIASVGDADGAAIEHARILSDIGWVHFRHGDLDRAQQNLEHALELISSQAAYDDQAGIFNRLGGVAWTRGDLVLAQRYVEQSLRASEQSGDLVRQASALNNLGILTESQGWIDDSLRYSLQALEINQRIGSRREESIAALNVGWALYDREDYQQAHRYFTQAYERAAEVRDTYMRMRALLNLGRTLAALGKWKAAEIAILRSQFIAVQLDLVAEQLAGQVVLAEMALQQGDIAAALAEYQRGLAFASDTESEEYGRFQRLEAKIAFAQGDLPRALELFTANVDLFTRLRNVPEADRTKKALAEMTDAGVAGKEAGT